MGKCWEEQQKTTTETLGFESKTEVSDDLSNSFRSSLLQKDLNLKTIRMHVH